ncbi:MAG: hypothetical protein ACI9S8_001458 [Chlamydiales bacterium]|jgi:hypothetical protein
MTGISSMEIVPLVLTHEADEISKDLLKKITPSSNLISNTALSSLAATSTTTGGLILFKVVVGFACPAIFAISTIALAGLGIHRIASKSYKLNFKETLHDFPGERGQPMVAICGYPFDSQLTNYELQNNLLGVESSMKDDFGRMEYYINDIRCEDFDSCVRKIIKLLPDDKYAHNQLTRISRLFNSRTCVDLNHKVATFFMKNKSLLKNVPIENVVFENHDKDPFVHLRITPNESYVYSHITWDAYDAINDDVRENRLIKSEVIHNLNTNSSTYSFSFE